MGGLGALGFYSSRMIFWRRSGVIGRMVISLPLSHQALSPSAYSMAGPASSIQGDR
jgi:hypothetical protein